MDMAAKAERQTQEQTASSAPTTNESTLKQQMGRRAFLRLVGTAALAAACQKFTPNTPTPTETNQEAYTYDVLSFDDANRQMGGNRLKIVLDDASQADTYRGKKLTIEQTIKIVSSAGVVQFFPIMVVREANPTAETPPNPGLVLLRGVETSGRTGIVIQEELIGRDVSINGRMTGVLFGVQEDDKGMPITNPEPRFIFAGTLAEANIHREWDVIFTFDGRTLIPISGKKVLANVVLTATPEPSNTPTPEGIEYTPWGQAILAKLNLDPKDEDAKRILASCSLLLTLPDGTKPDTTKAPDESFLGSIGLATLPERQASTTAWFYGSKCLTREGSWVVSRKDDGGEISVLRHSQDGSTFESVVVGDIQTIVETYNGTVVRTVSAKGDAWFTTITDPEQVYQSTAFSTKKTIGTDVDTPEEGVFYKEEKLPEQDFDHEGLRLTETDGSAQLVYIYQDGVAVPYYQETEDKWETVPWDSLGVNMGRFHVTVDQGTVYSEFVPVLEQHNIHKIVFNPDNPEVVEDMGRLVTTYLYLAYHEQHPEDSISYDAFVKDPGKRSITLPVKDEAGQIVPATIELAKLKRVSLRTATKGDLFISFQSLPYGKKFFARLDFDPTQGALTLTQKLNMPTIFSRWDSYPDDYFAGDREGMVKILAPGYTALFYVLSTMMLAKQRYLDYVPEADLRDVYEANESTGYQLSKFTDGPYRRIDPEAANYGLQTKQVENQEWTDYGYANVELALSAYNKTRSWGRGV